MGQRKGHAQRRQAKDRQVTWRWDEKGKKKAEKESWDQMINKQRKETEKQWGPREWPVNMWGQEDTTPPSPLPAAGGHHKTNSHLEVTDSTPCLAVLSVFLFSLCHLSFLPLCLLTATFSIFQVLSAHSSAKGLTSQSRDSDSSSIPQVLDGTGGRTSSLNTTVSSLMNFPWEL